MYIQRFSKIKSASLGLLLTGIALSLVGCDPRTGGTNEDAHGHAHGQGHAHETQQRRVRQAVAQLEPTEGNEARGTVTFTRAETGIRVTVEMTGLGAAGLRGFHIHEKGDCSAPDATSAGGHFNPTEMRHGDRTDDQRHAGDFGNLEVAGDGTARKEFIDTHIDFEGVTSIIGRAVIVHAAADDLKTQPTGDSGARAACGVIQVVDYFQ